jgi:hypothetical protein
MSASTLKATRSSVVDHHAGLACVTYTKAGLRHHPSPTSSLCPPSSPSLLSQFDHHRSTLDIAVTRSWLPYSCEPSPSLFPPRHLLPTASALSALQPRSTWLSHPSMCALASICLAIRALFWSTSTSRHAHDHSSLVRQSYLELNTSSTSSTLLGLHHSTVLRSHVCLPARLPHVCPPFPSHAWSTHGVVSTSSHPTCFLSYSACTSSPLPMLCVSGTVSHVQSLVCWVHHILLCSIVSMSCMNYILRCSIRTSRDLQCKIEDF